MSKGSDLLVAALENEGVDRVFGVPGEENLDVVESLRQSKHRAGIDAARAGGRLHGGDAWPAHRARGRVHLHAGPGRSEFLDRRRLRATRCDADDPADRAEGDHVRRSRPNSRSSTWSRR